MKRIKLVASDAVDEEYFDLVEELKIGMKSELKRELDSYFKDTRRNIDAAESDETETYKVEKDGLVNWIARKFFGGGYEERTRTYTTVRAGAVVDALENLTANIEQSINMVSNDEINEWKGNLKSGLTDILRKYIEDEDTDLNKIRKIVRQEINLIEFPDLTYTETKLPSGRGTLKRDEAEEFLEEVRNYINTLRKRVWRDIKDYLEELISNLLNVKISDVLFSEYDAQLEKLEKEIKNRLIALERHNKLIKALEEI